MAVEKLIVTGMTRFDDMAPRAPSLVKITGVEVDPNKRSAGPIAVWKVSDLRDYLENLVGRTTEGRKVRLKVQIGMVEGVRVVEQILGIEETG